MEPPGHEAVAEVAAGEGPENRHQLLRDGGRRQRRRPPDRPEAGPRGPRVAGRYRSNSGLIALIGAVEQRLTAATARAARRTQAFRGELVPTEAEVARRDGRDYEPASALLERIRAERAGQADTASQRRGHRRLP